MQALLADAVQNELVVACGIEGLDLPDEVLKRFGQAVVSRIDYGFRFRWDPAWAKGGPHQWAEEGRHYARCTTCLAVSPAAVSPEAAAAWYREHAGGLHNG